MFQNKWFCFDALVNACGYWPNHYLGPATGTTCSVCFNLYSSFGSIFGLIRNGF